MRVETTINGRKQTLETRANEILLHALRRAGYFGVKQGCNEGFCGSCVILVEGKPINSCLMLAPAVARKEVVTIEGLGTPNDPHPLQLAFAETGGTQCGFCVPGMIMSAKYLLDSNPKPSTEEICEAIDGNLCRCTGYMKQIEAIKLAAKRMRSKNRE